MLEPVVYLVEDDADVARFVIALIQPHFHVEHFNTACEALAEIDQTTRGCLLLDIELPGISGLAAQQTLRERGIEMPVVFLTGTADVATTATVMKRGAMDLLEKPFEPEQLVGVVQRAVQMDSDRCEMRNRRALIQQRGDRLTERERQVMRLLIAGNSNKQIGLQLGASSRTIEIHRRNLMRKMEADSLAMLIRLCVQIEPELAA